MNRVFIDMDGVIVDFDHYAATNQLTPDIIKRGPGHYRAMPPMPGAIAAVRQIIEMGFDVWIATKPPTGIAGAYAEKVEWILEHLPELRSRIVITHDKGMLGDSNDFLIDDRPEKANCRAFAGMLLHFTAATRWDNLIGFLRTHAPASN